MDIITLAVAKKYTDESLIGGGAVAGKNCTISSITDITGGKRVTFLWTLDDGTEKTGTMDVMNGINGINGADGEDAPTITGVTLNNDNSLTITMSDGTHYDTTPIPTVKGDNGYSPSATVTRVTDGIVLTVRDKTGTTQAKADDGFSPIVTMHRNAANTGVELTITDRNGSQTQTINDGSVTATVDYANVTSKPEINGVEVSGDKTLAEYGINIPTRNSQLTNDSGYITEADLPTVDTTLSSVSNNPISNKAVTDEIRATQSTLNDTISDVDANTSAISILNGNATVNGSVDKKISDALANLDRLTKQIVSELPPVSSAVENVIYLIPNPSGTAYEQWTIVDDGQGGKEYALLGSTDTDLTGYYTSTQTDSLLNDKQATITGAASSVTSLNLTANKVVVSDSNGKVAASSITTTELEALDDITGNVQSQLDGKQATLTYDLVPTDNSTNMVKSGGIKSALDEKQNVLTFDNTPTVNSNNPVKSGGVYTALEGKNEKFQYAELPIASVDLLGKIYMYTGATTSSLTNGSFYKCVLNPDTATYEWEEQSSGEGNVQADWTETDTTADSYIKNKPTLGTASAKDATDVVRPNNHNLAESGSVYNAIIGAVSSVYQPREPIAFSELTSSLLISENVGTVYKTTTSGTTTDDFMQGSGIPVNVGESIGIIKAGENTILFNLMGETIDLYDFQTKTLANTVEGASTVEGALSALSTNKASKSQLNGKMSCYTWDTDKTLKAVFYEITDRGILSDVTDAVGKRLIARYGNVLINRITQVNGVKNLYWDDTLVLSCPWNDDTTKLTDVLEIFVGTTSWQQLATTENLINTTLSEYQLQVSGDNYAWFDLGTSTSTSNSQAFLFYEITYGRVDGAQSKILVSCSGTMADLNYIKAVNLNDGQTSATEQLRLDSNKHIWLGMQSYCYAHVKVYGRWTGMGSKTTTEPTGTIIPIYKCATDSDMNTYAKPHIYKLSGGAYPTLQTLFDELVTRLKADAVGNDYGICFMGTWAGKSFFEGSFYTVDGHSSYFKITFQNPQDSKSLYTGYTGYSDTQVTYTGVA